MRDDPVINPLPSLPCGCAFAKKRSEPFEPIRRSIKFLQYFAHPDGSFGGHYGSRCTKFYYPSGILSMAQEIPEALVLDKYMQNLFLKSGPFLYRAWMNPI